MNVIIRKADERDFSAILLLIKEFAVFQGTPEKVTISLEQMTADRLLFQCYVAERDKDIVGFSSYFFAYYSWTGKALYLDDLYVQEAYRKEGIGKKLLEHIIELAKTHQCKKVRWQVSRWNQNAIAFYKSLGVVFDEVEINCDLFVNAVSEAVDD